MIQIAPPILSTDPSKIEDSNEMTEQTGTGISYVENPRNVFMTVKELAKKFEKS